jgi:hypothetical protein
MFIFRMVVLILFAMGSCAFAQLEVTEDFAPEEDETVAETSEPEEPVDEEAIRALTRHIQSRTQIREVNEPQQDHPANQYFQAVLSRLDAAPEHVRIHIVLANGTVRAGRIPNGLFEIKTPVGMFPLLWSEVQSLQNRDGTCVLQLRGGDGLIGAPLIGELILERDDASTEVLGLKDIQSVTVIGPEQ